MKLYQDNNHQSSETTNLEQINDNNLSLEELDKLVGINQVPQSGDDETTELLEESDYLENQKTKSRQNHAVTKTFVVVGFTAVLVVAVLSFLGGFNREYKKNRNKNQTTEEQTQSKTDPLKEAQNAQDEKIGALSTEIALGTQQRELAERRTTKVTEKTPVTGTTEKEQTAAPEPKQYVRQPSPPPQRVQYSPQPVPYARQPPTTPPPIPYVRQLPPVPPPAPVPYARQPLPAPLPYVRQPQEENEEALEPESGSNYRSSLQVPTIPPIPSPPPDPQQHIARAMNFGSYGEMDYSHIDMSEQSQPENIEQPQLSNTDIKSAENTINTNRQIAPGQQIDGILNTPIFWVEDLELAEQPQRFAIEISQPLLDLSGEVYISQGSLLIAQLKNTSQSGMVILEIKGAITPSRGILEIDPDILSITNNTGSPLIAVSQSQRGRKQSRNLSVMAGLSKVGQLLNRADSTTRYSSFGSSSSIETNRDANILGGILEGTFGELHRQTVEVESKELEKILDRPSVWMIPSGTSVRVLVNNSGW